MRCPECGQQVALAERCPYCGTPLLDREGDTSGQAESKERSWQVTFRGRATNKQPPHVTGRFRFWPWILRILRLLADPRVAAWRKVFFWTALIYILSPVDLRPDFIPLLGWLDDLLLGLVAYLLLSHGER